MEKIYLTPTKAAIKESVNNCVMDFDDKKVLLVGMGLCRDRGYLCEYKKIDGSISSCHSNWFKETRVYESAKLIYETYFSDALIKERVGKKLEKQLIKKILKIVHPDVCKHKDAGYLTKKLTALL